MFTTLAREGAAALGVPHLGWVPVAHPIGGLEPHLVAEKADAIVDQVQELLTREPRPAAGTPASAVAVVKAPDDLDAFQQFAMAEGWGDGLPALPPTLERVARILGRWASRRQELVAAIGPRFGEATWEAIAANAALAGAGPEHLAVIVAAIRAMTLPEFNLEGMQATTHPCGPLVIVNGPIRGRLGVAGGTNALGGGSRANAVIGRAVRLVLMNVGGARPGIMDRATLGHPGKYSYCLGEHEEASPWEPLHVERGFRPDESCVTVCASEGPHNVNDHGSTTADDVLTMIANTAATPGSNNAYIRGEPLVALGPEHARTIADSGWSKARVKQEFWRRARIPLTKYSPQNLRRFTLAHPGRFPDMPGDHDAPLCLAPEDVMVIVAGGAGKHSVFIPTFGATRSVTQRIEE